MTDRRYWKSHDELGTSANGAGREGSERPLIDAVDRRGFLKASGFTLAGTWMVGCSRGVVDKAIPYLIQPEEIIPGQATWYSTTCEACPARCGALVKSRDGRPIKLEGIRHHPISEGGLCAVGQASLLELYDAHRLAGPRLAGQPVEWTEVDRAIGARIAEIRSGGGRVRVLTETVTSPTEQNLIDRFVDQFDDGRHVVYDPLSSAAILDAHQITHGQRRLPRYDFSSAEVIVGLGADFLGSWISPVEFTAAYRRGRNLDGDSPRLSYHVQIEGRMSLTGSNADHRIRSSPTDYAATLGHLIQRVSRLGGDVGVDLGDLGPPPIEAGQLDELAERLWQARGRALVVSDSQSRGDQVLVNTLNQALDAYGATLDIERPSLQLQGNDRELELLVDEVESGTVDLLLIRGVNPVYDLPEFELDGAADSSPFVVSFAGSLDETAVQATAICPEPHFLESWRDSEPVAGVVAVAQPVITPLNDVRTLAGSLAVWLGEPQDDVDLIQEVWQSEVHPRSSVALFQDFWDRTVHDGWAAVNPREGEPVEFDGGQVDLPRGESSDDGYVLEIYPTVALRDGRHAHNPWLQELPDPVTKVVWDNYASVSPQTAIRLGVSEGDVVVLRAEGREGLEVPVYVQPGQHDRVIAVALGYGRIGTDRFAAVAPRWLQGKPTVEPGSTIGVATTSWAVLDANGRGLVRSGVEVRATGATRSLASTQTYHNLSVPEALAPTDGKDRPIIQETVLEDFLEDRSAGAPHLHHFDSDLWGEHEFDTHHWGMAVDLSACTGCSACVIACQAENNVPVVGRDEVRRRRDMHWIRIDRYYRGDHDDPQAVHQPMMCHHCDNAPCETVCPVVATLHSSEGLNMQAYNRCVGTRYCANNCPYKVRRFNWFDYAHDDKLQNLVLNPDVTVRERGVMEKCSFCVQRIQEAKFSATEAGEALADGDIQTACEQSCPAQAIVFGDLKDPESRIAKARRNPRHYVVFEELNVKPSVGYLRLVRNRPSGAGDHGGDTSGGIDHG